ncbi:hypothetical protein CLF_110426 [Clonorchis sinensis]|uniref:Uncharacterized protein n=1 Tax=Clonorchis sinensis TaxID=79923 RepID=G7YKP7_CLOSI|nr:hypothetical protein CLF_110426 [Clonorchis sinensis]
MATTLLWRNGIGRRLGPQPEISGQMPFKSAEKFDWFTDELASECELLYQALRQCYRDGQITRPDIRSDNNTICPYGFDSTAAEIWMVTAGLNAPMVNDAGRNRPIAQSVALCSENDPPVTANIRHRTIRHVLEELVLIELISSAYPVAVTGSDSRTSDMRGERVTTTPPTYVGRI